LGVITGVLLGLGVVALASSGINPYGTHTTMPQYRVLFTNSTSTQSWNTANTFGSSGAAPVANMTLGTIAGQPVNAAPLSQVNSVVRQPITLTGFVLLPILAAFLFGFVLYRVSRARNEGEEPPEAA
jgi:hypothetical protein